MDDQAGFAKDLRTWLNQLYILADSGMEVKGQSMSYLIKNLRGYDGWQIPSQYDDRLTLLERFGCKVETGRNDRGNKAAVVYMEENNMAAIAATELRLESD